MGWTLGYIELFHVLWKHNVYEHLDIPDMALLPRQKYNKKHRAQLSVEYTFFLHLKCCDNSCNLNGIKKVVSRAALKYIIHIKHQTLVNCLSKLNVKIFALIKLPRI